MDILSDSHFISSQDAIEFCHEYCLEYGFDIKLETDQNIIYICCSFGTHCPWMMILTQENNHKWTFKQAHSSEHNHLLVVAPMKKEDPWSQKVYDRINQLAKSHMRPSEIRQVIKLQFPDITWSNRRFYNYLKEKEHGRVAVVDRMQRLIVASSRLCSLVAANEEWANSVESDLLKLLDSFGHRSTKPPEAVVDLDVNMIYSDIDSKTTTAPTVLCKKRKTLVQDSGMTAVVSVPSCILYVRSQPLSRTEVRRAYNTESSLSSTLLLSSVQPQQMAPLPDIRFQPYFNTSNSSSNLHHQQMNYYYNPPLSLQHYQMEHGPFDSTTAIDFNQQW